MGGKRGCVPLRGIQSVRIFESRKSDYLNVLEHAESAEVAVEMSDGVQLAGDVSHSQHPTRKGEVF